MGQDESDKETRSKVLSLKDRLEGLYDQYDDFIAIDTDRIFSIEYRIVGSDIYNRADVITKRARRGIKSEMLRALSEEIKEVKHEIHKIQKNEKI